MLLQRADRTVAQNALSLWLTKPSASGNRIRTQFCVFPKIGKRRKILTPMKTIILKTLAPVIQHFGSLINHPPLLRSLFLILLAVGSFALSPRIQAQSNTADGENALLSITTGLYNSAFGFDALLSNTDASFNTGIGAGVLLLNTASENTATGAGALLSNTTGDENTANGTFALFNNIEGIRNTAIGNRALLNNTGDSNTAIGADALGTNAAGGFNVAIGGIALGGNAEGDGNTAIGVGALFQATGSFNTAVGRLAGQSITTANNIIAIGVQVDGVSSAFGQVDDSCYIDNIFGADVDASTAVVVGVDADGKLGTNAVDAAGNRVPLASLLDGQRQAVLSHKVEVLQATIAELESTIAAQRNGMDALTAQLKEQAALIQKVSAQLQVNKPGAQVVSYGQ